MKRIGNLWPQLTSWENLAESARAAARGKRKRPDVARFLHELEPNLCRLQRELEEGTYRPGVYRTFWIHDPKPRQISAAAFRDRVVHHALTRVLEPVFEPAVHRLLIRVAQGMRTASGAETGAGRVPAAPLRPEVRHPEVFPIDRSLHSEGPDRAGDQVPQDPRSGGADHRRLERTGGSDRVLSGRFAIHTIREATRIADRKSNVPVFCERLSESARPLRVAGITAGLVSPIRGRFRSLRRRQAGIRFLDRRS